MAHSANSENRFGPIRFGAFELDPRTGELRRSGVRIHLQPQPAKLLELLLRRPGDLVTREEIQRELWSGETYVDYERSINICVMQIRAALDDDAETPRFVETLPRRGYRFVADVHRVENGAVAEDSFPGATGSDAQKRIRRLAVILVVLLGSGLLWKQWPRRVEAPGPATPARAMLAVLPFENLSGKGDLAYVADGMTEELIAQLGRIAPERLGVIARTSAMRYRGTRESVKQIGSELNVAYVVEGSVRLEKGRSWVTAQLIRVSDQTHLWADTYEMDGTSVFAQQQMAAVLVVQNVAEKLGAASSTAAGHSPATSNPAAMEAYLRGRYHFHKGDEITEAVRQLEHAVVEDARFAAAQALLAEALHFAAMVGERSVEEARPRAIAASDQALLADAFSSEAQAAKGLVAFWFSWNPQEAATHFQKALAANPSDAKAHHDYAWTLVALGRDEDAVREIQAAQALDPVSPRANMDLGWIYLGVRRYDDAIRHCSRMLEIEPRVYEAAQSCLERAFFSTGKVAEAADAALKQYERDPSLSRKVRDWKKLPAERALKEIWEFRLQQRLARPGQRKAYRAGELSLLLGRKEDALRYLEQAFAEHEMMMVLLYRAPEFEALKDEPRFKTLLNRIQPAA